MSTPEFQEESAAVDQFHCKALVLPQWTASAKQQVILRVMDKKQHRNDINNRNWKSYRQGRFGGEFERGEIEEKERE